MVIVGYVIEKNEKAINYFYRFLKVFRDVRASPFGKKKLFDKLEHTIRVFDDRIVFAYSGTITAFSTIMFLLKIAILLLLVILLFLSYNNFMPIIKLLVKISLFTGLLVLGVYYLSYSNVGFWLGHLRTMKKEKFGLKHFKKKLLSNSEIINCFVYNKKPLFNKELGVKK